MRKPRKLLVLIASFAFYLTNFIPLLPLQSQVQAAPPADFTAETLITGLDEPTAIEFLPDGRMLILERGGTIHVVQAGASTVDPTAFMQITNINVDQGERGLTGIDLDPNFETNGYFYLFYTRNSPLRDTVSRFTANGNTADVASEVVIWQAPEDADLWHHGGSVLVGPDNMLYISTGDGFDTPNNSQSLTSYQGKLLRVAPDGSVPAGNPFDDATGPNYDYIWALGLRNPFRISLDSVTGRIYIGDVGGNDSTNSYEEVNVGVSGANYGWPVCEGPERQPSGGSCTPPSSPGTYQSPFFYYSHSGRDASVTGGFVYRSGNFPSSYEGDYFYGDYVRNWIRGLDLDPVTGALNGTFNFEPEDGSEDGPYGEIVDLEQGPDGALYYVDIGISWEGNVNPGTVRRIKYTAGNEPPVIGTASADPTSGPDAPLSVSFTASATDPEGEAVTYSWDFGDGTPVSSEQNPSHAYQAKGQYTARLTVSDGVNQSLSDPITVVVGIPPAIDNISVTTPSDQSGGPVTFRAGEDVSFSAAASDADGTLGEANYSWDIQLIHLSHTHPEAGPIEGSSGVFTIPTSGHEINDDIQFQFVLTVTDSDGLTATGAVYIIPETVNLTFDSNPTGLDVNVDGFNRTTPSVLNTVINFEHTIGAPSPQGQYEFVSWSDGGAQTHTIVAPAATQSYVATYQETSTQIPGLMAGYAFEEGSGTTVSDASGNGRDLTLSGSPSWSTGQFGGGLTLDGNDDRGSVGSFPLPAQFTYMAWVNNPSNQDWETIMTVGTPRDWYLNSGAHGFQNGAGDVFFNTSVPTGSWQHVALTYDGSQMQIYLNGVAAGTPQSMSIGSITDTFQIGAWIFNGGNVDFFSGTVDEVRVYDRALTQTEIESAMSAPLAGGNTPPVATDDLATTDEDTGITINVLANDTDSDGDALGVDSATQGVGGATVVNPDDTITYTPNANFNGSDSFTYTIADGNGGSDTATVNVTVNAVNDAPVADDESVTTEQNTAVGVTLTATDVDGDALGYSVVDQPTGGVLSGSAPDLTYTPNTDFLGNDSFTFRANDGTLDSNLATITITVVETNDPPVADDQNVTTNEDSAVAITLTAADPEGDPLTYSVVDNPTNGALSGTAPNLTYTPSVDFNGADSFTFRANDGLEDSNLATVSISVNAVNDAPVADDSTATTQQDTAVDITLAANDVDGDALTYGVVDNPANGSLSGTAPNLTYTPNGGFAGVDSFTFRANDGTLESNLATVSITVESAYNSFSLQFDGEDDLARFVDLPFSSVYTYEAWVRRTADSGGYETFMSDANSNYSQATFTLYVDGGNFDCPGASDQFAYYQTASGSLHCSGVTAQLNQWYHIAVTRESNGTRRFFVNGQLVNTQSGTPDPSNSNGRFSIGRAGDYNGEYFPGLVDEVRISNVVRYSASFTPQTSNFATDANTVVLYHLDEGTGQILADSSGNNRNGTLGSTTSSQSSDPLWSGDSPITSN